MDNFYKKLLKVKLSLIMILCLCILYSLNAQTEKKLVLGEQPVYKVSKAKGTITVDGKMNEASWENSELRPFRYFYRGERAPDKQNTKFRMLWDEVNIYLFYECEDTSLTAREKIPDAEPYIDDCAEFFCLPIPDSLNIHFAFELNLYKAAYDFVILYGFNTVPYL